MKIYNPTHLTEALELLETKKTGLLAGGTDFIVKYKEGILNCESAVNILNLPELKNIIETKNTLKIGSLVTHQEIIDSSLVKEHLDILKAACSVVGSPQIRNRGTLGGNIATASPAGDSLPALMVLESSLVLKSIKGERIVKIKDFFIGPGKTILKDNEIITEIEIPKIKPEEKGFFKKLGTRNALAISIVGAAAKVKFKNSIFEKVEIALGAVGSTVFFKRLDFLEGITVTKKELWAKLQAIKEMINPITDIRGSADYRKEMAVSLLYQGLSKYI